MQFFQNILLSKIPESLVWKITNIDTSCTDGNTAFGCDSDKNSLVFIYMF